MRVRQALPLLFLAAVSAAAGAAGLQAQRDDFRTLLDAAERGRLARYDTVLARLGDYPLRPYLTAADLSWRLRHRHTAALDAQIRDFIAAHPDLPAADDLRRRWLRDAAGHGRWDTVLAYARDGDDTDLQCLALTARIRTGAAPASELVAEGLSFWRRGRSQPDACDPVFAWLDQQNALTAVEIRHRIKLAIDNGAYGLAGYLARKLPKDAAAEVERWLWVVRRPHTLRDAARLDADVAVTAFKRLARRDLDTAAALQPVLAERHELDADRRHEMQRYVALLYAQEHDERALDWFRRLPPGGLTESGRGWRIRSALYHEHWREALEWIDALPPDERGEEEWRYWRGRALAALDRNDEAEAVLAPLAHERSYHGYLAADALDRPYNLNRRPLARDPAILEDLGSRPAIRRAREFHALAMLGDARKEWDAAAAGLSPQELRQAALLAHDWQWHERAIVTLVRADYWDDLDIRYPLPHLDAVGRVANATDLERAYILAIMRTESLFAADARSPAGALGLMQLMPATARRTASGGPWRGARSLLEPETGIRLGGLYLSRMRARFDGHPALASAAYNAGPTRVARWLPERAVPADVWIANIPYTETRKYVQRAMSHMTVFQARLDEPVSRLSQRLPPVPGEKELVCRAQTPAVC